MRWNGARKTEVEEPVFTSRPVLFEFEVDEVAEPKALLPKELRLLISMHGSSEKASKAIGASEAFVRQNSRRRIRQPIEK